MEFVGIPQMLFKKTQVSYMFTRQAVCCCVTVSFVQQFLNIMCVNFCMLILSRVFLATKYLGTFLEDIQYTCYKSTF